MVEWTTADATTPVVMYGTSDSSLTRTASATTKTYNASSMCGSPANSTGYIDPGMLHSALLSNLSYNTKYHYQYGDMVSSPVLPVDMSILLAFVLLSACKMCAILPAALNAQASHSINLMRWYPCIFTFPSPGPQKDGHFLLFSTAVYTLYCATATAVTAPQHNMLYNLIE